MKRARTTLIAAALGLALLAPAVSAQAAPAHNVVIATTPEAGQTLNRLPDAFSITTNEAMLDLPDSEGFVLQIRDGEGLYYGDGCVVVSGATMSAVPALGDPGDYTMLWQAVSADGHTIDGEVPFYWQPLGTIGKIAKGYEQPPVCGVDQEAPVASPATDEPNPVAEEPAASGIDLATVLWVGGILLAAGIAIAVGITLGTRRRT